MWGGLGVLGFGGVGVSRGFARLLRDGFWVFLNVVVWH